MNWAIAAAKSLQLCPTLCDHIDGSPPESAVPGILQARTLEWVAISFSNAWKWKVKVKSLSRVWPLAQEGYENFMCGHPHIIQFLRKSRNSPWLSKLSKNQKCLKNMWTRWLRHSVFIGSLAFDCFEPLAIVASDLSV